MNRTQTIRKLKRWNGNIRNKVTALRRASKIYAVFGYFNKLVIATLTAILIAMNSFNISEDSHPILITVTVLQVVLAFFTAIEAAINPSKLSNQCTICWKQYMELSRELAVTIDVLHKDSDIYTEEEQSEEISYEKYTNLSLLYSTKEQLILNVEPMVFFSTTSKTAVDASSD